jgi:hypothetical protein
VDGVKKGEALQAVLAEWPALLGRVTKGYNALTAQQQALPGSLPELTKNERPKSIADLERYVDFDSRISVISGAPASAPIAVPPVPTAEGDGLTSSTARRYEQERVLYKERFGAWPEENYGCQHYTNIVEPSH